MQQNSWTDALKDLAAQAPKGVPVFVVDVGRDVSENLAEIELVRTLYPEASSYLDVYARYGLVGPRSIFGHCIHLAESEVAALASSGSFRNSTTGSTFRKRETMASTTSGPRAIAASSST